uniref:Uncharacterized protein n=1 Tax=uncultured marine virus TaxID=186617 RepID=A0A0F7LB18_9VIRU|nr:hypothetical protein [uncultured marine virus]
MIVVLSHSIQTLQRCFIIPCVYLLLCSFRNRSTFLHTTPYSSRSFIHFNLSRSRTKHSSVIYLSHLHQSKKSSSVFVFTFSY